MKSAALVGTIVLALGLAVASERESSAENAKRFDSNLVAKGAQLAAIGNCMTCHTREGGQSFAGGRPIPTPFGVLYSTNITPDRETGIGRWSEADFLRAMHEGVDREGQDLYPAFPYDHFTRVADDDVAALYTYFMTREPVSVQVPGNRLRFPMNLRASIRLWKAAYFRPGIYRADPARTAQWNRGAYLVEGLAHCGACHTPRNDLGAERTDQALGGGDAEGWHATALNAESPAPVRWTADELYDYLRHGHEAQHGTAAGPMADVSRNLADVSEADVRAIAAYVAAQMPDRPSRPRSAGERATSSEGGAIFAGACANCHGSAPPAFSGASVPLALTTSLNEPDPRNAIHVIMEGLQPEPGESGALMPAFAGELTDAQVAALLDYLRAHFTDRAAWRDVAREVAAIRQSHTGEP